MQKKDVDRFGNLIIALELLISDQSSPLPVF